jgi:hypothetical protein
MVNTQPTKPNGVRSWEYHRLRYCVKTLDWALFVLVRVIRVDRFYGELTDDPRASHELTRTKTNR